MRVIIIPEDSFMYVDGVGKNNVNLSFVPKDIHALQWYGSIGEIEYQDQFGRATVNQTINSLDQFPYYQQCYEAWLAAPQQ